MRQIENSVCTKEGCYLEDYKKKLGYDDISKNASSTGVQTTKINATKSR